MAKFESSSVGSNVATISVDHPPSLPSSSTSIKSNGTVMISSGDSTRFSSSGDSTIVSSESSTADRLSHNSRIPEDHSTIFTRFMDYFFRNVGYLITDHAKLVLTVVLIFTLLTSIKIPFTKQEDDLKTGYTPNGARSHQEVAMHEEFYSKNGSDPISVVVFIVAKDNGTLTRPSHLNETVKVMDHIGHTFFMPNNGNTSSGQPFYEFCTDFCEFNEPLRHFRNGFVIQSNPDYALLQPGELFDSRINLSFPFMSVLGRELDLSPLFFGVRKFSSDEAQRQAHLTTNIEHLPLIVLQYRADKPKYATKEDVQAWERTIERYYHYDYNNEHIRIKVMSITVAADEIVKNGMTLFPFIILGFIILSTFALITGYCSSYYFDQWTIHKVSLAIFACVCPLLATSSSLGLLFWCGFRFGSILAVTPFLVLAIGVDDAFLMIHSWQRICVKQRKLRQTTINGRYGDLLRNRIAEMCVDVGPSISITSLTNAISFIIGYFSPTPEIQLFCAGNALAIFFDYIYQFVFFGTIMAIAGDFEMKSESKRDKESIVNVESTEKRKKLHVIVTSFLKHYCRWAADSFTSFLMLLCLIVYWIVSIRGALTISPSITPDKLFLADSPVNEVNWFRDTYILPNYTAINVFVNNVGNFSSPEKQQRVRNLIAEYEKMPLCLGKEYTHFWLRDFDKYLETTIEDDEAHTEFEDFTSAVSPVSKHFSYTKKNMQQFLNWPEYKHWNAFIKFDDKGNLAKFFAVVAFHGKELVSWNKRGELLNEWRAIADNYSDLEAWVFEEDAQFLDQIATLIPSTISSSIVTLVCMTVVCIIFMYNLFTVCVATFSIMSVCIGVFGFLAMWRIDLDPISMATTIMSIGFSVDFPAHASFHYYRTGIESGGKLSPEQRIYHVLSAIGFPLLQCGISTILFVFCLLFVPSYMSEVFVKTMVLVIIFGLIHGLFIIPVALCSLTRIYDAFFAPQTKVRNAIKKLQKSSSFKNMMSVTRTHPDDKNIAKVTVHDTS